MVFDSVSAQGLGINMEEISSSIWSSIPPELMDKISLILDLSIAILLAGIIYFVILLIIKIAKLIFGSKEARILKKIESEVSEILMVLSKGRKIEKKEAENKTDESEEKVKEGKKKIKSKF